MAGFINGLFSVSGSGDLGGHGSYNVVYTHQDIPAGTGILYPTTSITQGPSGTTITSTQYGIIGWILLLGVVGLILVFALK